ncbi:MAG: hypothetical protein MUE44_25325 [Oscillatoriaceae cyanobacterium Prado104]|jgi:hypothetical protein|nr:hypothetical protein [Oscillatoriaceae cyanobacterium Prado104]
MKIGNGKSKQKNKFQPPVGAKHSGDDRIEKTKIYIPECFAQSPRKTSDRAVFFINDSIAANFLSLAIQ